MHRQPGHAQRGAALLLAMLVVTLVATLSAGAVWLQWRQVEIESAERQRSQLSWLLTGAMDWSRLILREDALSARSGGTDHLAEPWALPVQESRLSTFLSQDRQLHEGDPEVFLSGRIIDAQSRLNLASLVQDGRLVPEVLTQWARLFALLGLPPAELELLASQWLRAQGPAAQTPAQTPVPAARPGSEALRPLRAQRIEQLVWLGLSPATVTRLAPFATVLPEPTPVNLHTASLEVLLASLPGLDTAAAQRLLQARERGHFANLEEVRRLLGPLGAGLHEQRHALRSAYFEITGELRIDALRQTERALAHRSGAQVRLLWRERQLEHLQESSLQ